jgi:hypothetical protein
MKMTFVWLAGFLLLAEIGLRIQFTKLYRILSEGEVD